MTANAPIRLAPAVQQGRRRRVRYLVACLAAACALTYVAIGAGLIYPATEDPQGLMVFGLLAGGTYALGVVACLVTDRLGAQILGIALQVVVLVGYVAVSGARTPPFEPVGLLLTAVQVVILITLLWLALAPGGRCECAWCRHHRDLHKGRCRVPTCRCDVFL